MKKKTKQDYYNLAKKYGFKWVGRVLPKNIHTKTLWRCKKKHQWEAEYNSVSRGSGCPFCAGKASKIEQDYHDLARNRDFKWVGDFPKTAHHKTLWQCKRGHRWFANYNNIRYGTGCPICYDHIKKIKQDYYELAKNRGFEWVGKILPENASTKTTWKCKEGHKWKAPYSAIQYGRGCPYCYGNVKKMEKDYHLLAESREFKWVGEYLPKNIMTKTQWECKKNHRWKARYNNIKNGSSCPVCANTVNGIKVSKPQIKLNNLLCGSLNYPEAQYCIDVAIMRKSQKIAVEYDCWYWHQGKEEHDSKRDSYLMSCGWKVLHVKSGNLVPTRKRIKSAINCLLKSHNRVYNLYLKDWK